MKQTKLLGIIVLVFLAVVSCKTDTGDTTVITNEQKGPTSYTTDVNNALLEYLPFGEDSDKKDLEDANRGYIGTNEDGWIPTELDILPNVDPDTAYSMLQFDFLKEPAPGTANPSLWRQSYMNSINGLFQVRPRAEGSLEGQSVTAEQGNIYQVRGFDLANMSLIKGTEGWIIIDPLTVKETAYAAMELVREKLGEFPVTNVIFTHSHIDHFGGINGIIQYNNEHFGEDYKDRNDITIYVPQDFFEHSVSENVMAGSAMGRRAAYMYGNILAKDTLGTFGSGLGTTTAVGIPGIFDGDENAIISNLEPELIEGGIDGIAVEIFYTPQSEAPAEMMFYFPGLNAFCQSEDINKSLHNLYTLRGAKVRDGLKWSKYVDKAIKHYGGEVEFSFGSHHWPTWDEDIVPFWEKQRDMYRFLHDQTLRLANKGFTPREISEMLVLPESIDKFFANRGYYGSVRHNIKAQYQLYFGWFDGNPANLNPHPPTAAAERYVKLIGADNMITEAREAHLKGDYRWAAELMNHLVFADPANQDARNVLADAYEQMGYQAESGPWRNFYLSGAGELREGMGGNAGTSTVSPDMIAGMSTELLLDYIAMRFQGNTNGDMKHNFNLTITGGPEGEGTGDGYHASLIIVNGAATARIGTGSHLTADDVDGRIIDVTLDRAAFEDLCFNPDPVKDVIENPDTNIETDLGGKEALSEFFGAMDKTSYWFQIVESNVVTPTPR